MKLSIPSTMETIFLNFSSVFTARTFENFTSLCIGAIITRGRKTITNILQSIKPMRTKHFGTYHRFLSRAAYHLLPAARVLSTMIITNIPNNIITLVVDEKLLRHKGPHVYGRGLYQDRRGATYQRRIYIYGHKWLVVSILVKFPWCSRPWALPIMAFFCPGKMAAERMHYVPHSLTHVCIFTLKLLHRWFPERHFKLIGDGVFATFFLIRFCSTHAWCTLISRLRANANLYADPEPDRHRRGRKRLKGAELPCPKKIIADAHAPWQRTWVNWYGNKRRALSYVSHHALIYKAGHGIVPIQCVITDAVDTGGRPESFLTTDLTQLPRNTIEDFVGRWSIEVTFEEATAHLGIESTRNYSQKSVLRTFPLLLGLFSIVSWWYHLNGARDFSTSSQSEWYVKEEPTFADALTAMRLQFWNENIFSTSSCGYDFIKIDRSLLISLCNNLCRAA